MKDNSAGREFIVKYFEESDIIKYFEKSQKNSVFLIGFIV